MVVILLSGVRYAVIIATRMVTQVVLWLMQEWIIPIHLVVSGQQPITAIASCNVIIGLDPAAITGDADLLELIITGEAYALRALHHFNLMQYYGQEHNGDAAWTRCPLY